MTNFFESKTPAPAPHALPKLAAARNPAEPHVLHHDLETRSRIDLKAVGAAKYASDLTTEVLCLAYAIDNEPTQLWTPGDPIPPEFIEAATNPLWTTNAHNDGFERPIARHILERRHGFPAIPIGRRRCSMAMAYAAALPGSLEKVIEALGLPYPKDKAGQALMRRMSKPRPDGSWIEDAASLERLYAYCRRDVESERAVYNAVSPLAAEEQRLWQLDAVINDRGFAVDGELLEAAHRVVTKTEAKLQAEFRELTGLDSTNQTGKFIAWLAAHDCVVDDIQKGTLKHVLRRKGLAPEVRRAIELRLQLAHASAVKVEALLAWRHADNRVRGSLVFHAASTGRWAGRGPQPQNFKRDSEGIDAKITAIMNGGVELDSPVEAVGDIARGMIVAAPGHRLLIGDFSGIESRVTARVSGQLSKLDQWAKFDRTGAVADDPYYILGRACGLAEDIARAKGKICDLAFGYQGGVGAWKAQAPDDDPSTDDDIQRYQKSWRKRHPYTVAFWRGINNNAIAAVRTPDKAFTYKGLRLVSDGKFLRITLPSGRALSYPFSRIERGAKYDDPRVIFKDASGGKWVDCRFGHGAYGGLWTENIVSAIARDLLAGAMRRLEAAGYPIVLTVHDEIVCEVPDDFGSLEEFRSIITAAPDWVTGTLPIAAKVRESLRFSKPDAPGTTTTNVIRLDGVARSDDLSIPEFLKRSPNGAPVAGPESEPESEFERDPDDDLGVGPELDDAEPDRVDSDELAALLDAAGDGKDHPGPDHNDEPADIVSTHQAAGGAAAPAGAQEPNDIAAVVHGLQASIQSLRTGRVLHGDIGSDAEPKPNAGNGAAEGGRGNGHAGGQPRGKQQTGGNKGSENNGAAGAPITDPELGPYIYRDARGNPHAKVVRTPSGHSRFTQQHWTGSAWFAAMPKRKLPYRLPELLAADLTSLVCITEGEKDAVNVAKLGFVATTNPNGAKGWNSAKLIPYFAHLNHFVILEDNDEAGRERTKRIIKTLRMLDPSPDIRVVSFPELPEGGDVSDWLAQDQSRGRAELLARIEAVSAGCELNEWDAGDLLGQGLPPPRQWVYGWQLCRRFLSSLVSPGDIGKTTMRLTQAIELTTGRELLGHRIYQRSRVLVVSLEDDRDELWRRLLAICRHHHIDPAELAGWLFCADITSVKLVEEVDGERVLGELEPMLRKAIERRRPDLVILDPFVKLHALDENKNPDMDFVCSQLIKLALEFNIAIDSPAHTRKGQLTAGDSDNRRGASAQRDAGRLDYTLTAMSEEEAEQFGIDPDERKSYVRLDRAKANIVRAIKATWYRLVNVPLGNMTEVYPEGDQVQALEVWVPPDAWLDLDAERINRILDKIESGLPDGNRYSDAPRATKRAAWKVIVAEMPEKAEAQAREIIRTWVKNGLLVNREYENPTDRKSAEGLFVDAAKRPTA